MYLFVTQLERDFQTRDMTDEEAEELMPKSHASTSAPEETD